MTTLRMGVTMANNPGMTLDQIVDYARLAERLGYESFWITEDNIRDAFVVLDRVARGTERIRLGTGITSIYARTPTTIALSAATVQNDAGGRLFLGLGIGGIGFVTRGHGATIERPVARMREAVEIVRALVRGDRLKFRGTFYTVEDFHLREPARFDVPIYLAALNPLMTRLGGEVAEGILTNFLTVERCERQVKPWLAEGRARAGRTGPPPLVGTLALTPAEPESPEALLPVRRRMAFYGSSPHYHDVIGAGGFGEQARRIHGAWFAGQQDQAVELVSREMAEHFTLAGSRDKVVGQLADYRRAEIYPVVYPLPRPGRLVEDYAAAITHAAECARRAGMEGTGLPPWA